MKQSAEYSRSRDGVAQASMEKRWNVYHGNDYLGLKTAKEIRETLRQGTLDPFDKVSREGSNIREDLIEVDEIFRETNDAPAPDASAPAPAGQGPEGTVVMERSPVGQKPGKVAAPAPKSARQDPDEEEESDDSEDFSQKNDTSTRNSAKRYYLIDREKVLGPLSALEIQSLFNRNMLNKKVRVQKIGSEKTIPITQFIASYSGDRLKELAEDGRIPQQIGVGSPSSKVMNELARMANSRRVAQDRKNRAYLIMSLFGLILGAGVYLIYEQSTSSHRGNIRQSSSSDESGDEGGSPEPSKSSKGSRPRLLQKAPEPPKLEPVDRNKKKAEKPKEESSRAPEPTRSSDSKTTRKQPETGSVSRVSQGGGEGRNTDSIPQGPGPVAKAIETAGRIQTIGPLTFSSSALESCASKCTLTLSDATGASLKAIFFKNAYSDQLRARAKGVFLTGNTKMERGELTVFIQDIR